jgi:hypothetical protein
MAKQKKQAVENVGAEIAQVAADGVAVVAKVTAPRVARPRYDLSGTDGTVLRFRSEPHKADGNPEKSTATIWVDGTDAKCYRVIRSKKIKGVATQRIRNYIQLPAGDRGYLKGEVTEGMTYSVTPMIAKPKVEKAEAAPTA